MSGMMEQALHLCDFLVQRDLLTPEAGERARRQARAESARLETVLLNGDFISETDLLPALSDFLRMPCVDIREIDIDPEAAALLPSRFANRHTALPFARGNGSLRVALPPGFDLLALDGVRLHTGLDVEPCLCRRDLIQNAIRKHYGFAADTVERMSEEDGLHLEMLDSIQPGDESRDMVNTAPVVRFVDQVLLEALKDRATDIHIEPYENALRIRMRIDGMLFEQPAPPGILRFHPAIVSRIKIMADMDIAEKRLPQDGRVKLRIAGEEIDLRISTVPTPHGESVEIRILRRAMMLMGLGELGIMDKDLQILRRLIRRPNGIILVTGPTGSGKTTTLYSALNEINSEEKKIITIEDPVEYMLRGVNQMQVKPGIGLTFANGLRSILRHDPDVIMVGEIRDAETADIAIRAALTGHLVFSTLHTNDAPGAITRLLDMGVEPFLAASSMRAVVAQRLIRLLCPRCKQETEYDAETLRRAGVPAQSSMRLFQARGCDHCRNQGYTDRTGIYEILTLDDILRLLIIDRSPTDQIRRTAMESGMTTLRQDGWDKVRRGLTSLEEVLRVTRKD